MLLFFLEYVPVHFPLRGGLIRRSVAADDISFAAIFYFKSVLSHSVAAPSPDEILLSNLSRGPLVRVPPRELIFWFALCVLGFGSQGLSG